MILLKRRMKINISDDCYLKNVFVRTIIVEEYDEEKLSEIAYSETRKFATDLYGLKDWTINKDSNGKPFFVKNRGYYFSVSHTKGMLALALCKGTSVGIDVEIIRKINKKITEKYYTKSEKKRTKHLSSDSLTETIKIWTMKEAHCKWQGRGLDKESLKWDSIEQNEVITESICVGQYMVSVCRTKEYAF